MQKLENIWLDTWMKSTSYKNKETGFYIDGLKGYIEAMNIWIKGTIHGGIIEASEIRSANFAGYTRIVSPGDNIQDAINEVAGEGGGTVFIKNGIYSLTTDLIVPSRIYIIGQNSESCYLDFQNNAAGVKFVGGGAYSTGTVTIANGSTTVTGNSTVFSTSMIGKAIMLNGLWYPITGVTNDTELTIAINYAGEDITLGTYVIANKCEDIKIQTLTVYRSMSAGLTLQYANEFWAIDCNFIGNLIGIKIDDSSNVNISVDDVVSNGYGIVATNTHYSMFDGTGVINNSVGGAMTFTNCSSCDITSCFNQSSAGNGITLNGCNDIGISNTNNIKNGGDGIELVANNNNIIINSVGCRSNGGDGIKLTATSDNCIVANCPLTTNAGWGINIANANCDNNQIRNNQYKTNVSGTYQDLGTNTRVDGVSGSFTTVDGKTVTVVDGNVMSIL